MRYVFLILKFGLLTVLYLFILRVFYFIMTDLRSAAKRSSMDIGFDSGPGAELVVTESNLPSLKPGDAVKLGAETRIGRGKSNDFNVQDSFVSHNHARIIFRQHNYFLEDLNSINGTYINGIRVREIMPLKHGDAVKVAGVTFKFARWENEVE